MGMDRHPDLLAGLPDGGIDHRLSRLQMTGRQMPQAIGVAGACPAGEEHHVAADEQDMDIDDGAEPLGGAPAGRRWPGRAPSPQVQGLCPLDGYGGDLDQLGAQPFGIVLGEGLQDLLVQDVPPGQPAARVGDGALGPVGLGRVLRPCAVGVFPESPGRVLGGTLGGHVGQHPGERSGDAEVTGLDHRLCLLSPAVMAVCRAGEGMTTARFTRPHVTGGR